MMSFDIILKYVIAQAKFTITGPAPEEMIKSRLEICQECDQFDKVTISCRECGCACAGGRWTNKLIHPSENCPLGKW